MTRAHRAMWGAYALLIAIWAVVILLDLSPLLTLPALAVLIGAVLVVTRVPRRTQEPTRLDRFSCARRYVEVPWALSPHATASQALVLALPVTWRRVNRAYAGSHRYFWMPCPRCGREFGGHESGRILWEQWPQESERVEHGDGVTVSWRHRSGTSVCRFCSREIQQMLARNVS